jgi:hypothetical protein
MNGKKVGFRGGGRDWQWWWQWLALIYPHPTPTKTTTSTPIKLTFIIPLNKKMKKL